MRDTNGGTAQRVVQVRAGGHGGGRAGRADGRVAGAAPAAARRRLRPAHLRVRAARLRAARLLRPARRRRARPAHLHSHIPRDVHAQLDVVDRRRYRSGERFLTALRSPPLTEPTRSIHILYIL